MQKLRLGVLLLLVLLPAYLGGCALPGCGTPQPVPPTTLLFVIEDAQGVARPYADEWLDALFTLQAMLDDLDGGSWNRPTAQDCLDRMEHALQGLEALDLPAGEMRGQLPGMKVYLNDVEDLIAAIDDGDMDKAHDLLQYVVD